MSLAAGAIYGFKFENERYNNTIYIYIYIYTHLLSPYISLSLSHTPYTHKYIYIKWNEQITLKTDFSNTVQLPRKKFKIDKCFFASCCLSYDNKFNVFL